MGRAVKHYEEYTAEVARKRLLRTTCDKCNISIPDPQHGRPTYDTGRPRRVFRLECYNEERYPDFAWKNGWGVGDLCDVCAAWLLDALIEAGVTITYFDHEDC